jgi:hypothetical protein
MQNIARVLIQNRTSPISREAAILTLVLAALALTMAMWTQLKFTALPNMLPLTLGVLVLDILSQFAPQTPIVRAVQSMLFGVLYLAISCFCGILAAYATQRFSLPLQDQFFERTDLALGVNWFDVAHWVDDRPVIHEILKLAYGTWHDVSSDSLAGCGSCFLRQHRRSEEISSQLRYRADGNDRYFWSPAGRRSDSAR